MNQDKLNQFCDIYAEKLRECVISMPEKYAYPVEKVPGVVTRMRAAFQEDSYHLDGPAIKATCKQLGIKFTRKAIREFLA